MSSKAKLYLNGIPVYRYFDLDTQGASVKYVLFEDNEEIGHVLHLPMFLTKSEEYRIVLESINKLIDDDKIQVREIEYEQNRRSSEWLLKSSQREVGVIIRGTGDKKSN